jgi:hypothetical protein
MYKERVPRIVDYATISERESCQSERVKYLSLKA